MDDKNRRRALLFRSWHRGMNEMDLLMGRFAETHLSSFTPEQLDQYEAILDMNDPDVFAWVTGMEKVPPDQDAEVLRLLVAHHAARKKATGE